MQLVIAPSDLTMAVRRTEHLLAEYPAAVVSVASYRREMGAIVLVLDINMGPARQALLGHSSEVQAGYGFIWALVKTLYYTRPRFCSPPADHERIDPTQDTHDLLARIAT